VQTPFAVGPPVGRAGIPAGKTGLTQKRYCCWQIAWYTLISNAQVRVLQPIPVKQVLFLPTLNYNLTTK